MRNPMTYEEIKDLVTGDDDNNRFGVTQHPQMKKGVLFSQGIILAWDQKGSTWLRQDIQAALIRFEAGEWGDALISGEKNTAGREYGRYPTSMKEPVCIHREAGKIIVYWPFER